MLTKTYKLSLFTVNALAELRTHYIHSDIVTGTHLPQRLCKCICIILDLVFIFHSLLYVYSPFLPVCIDNEFPLPDWFQRFGAVQTLSVLRHCRESLWRQVCLVQLFSYCWVGEREKGSFCVPLSKKLPASFFEFFPQFAWRCTVSTLTAPLSQAVRFSFWTGTIYWQCEIRLLCLLERCITFRGVVGLLLCWDSTLPAQFYDSRPRFYKKIVKSVYWYVFGLNRTQDSWNEVPLEHLQWLSSGEDREILLKHLKAFGVSLKQKHAVKFTKKERQCVEFVCSKLHDTASNGWNSPQLLCVWHIASWVGEMSYFMLKTVKFTVT